MGMDEEAVAQTEVSSREINEEIDRAHDEAGREGYVRVMCECADPLCERVVAVTGDEYDAVRAHGRRFVLAKGHARREIETVVAETERYLVVEKDSGTPAEVAEETDPRA